MTPHDRDGDERPGHERAAHKRNLAHRFARLPAEKQAAFLALLREQGIAFERLPIVPVPAGRPPVLSHAQARQWFLWQLAPASTAYHVAGALRLQGPLHLAALRHAVAALRTRHEALRTVFVPTADGLAEPRLQPVDGDQVELVDLCAAGDGPAAAQARCREAEQRIVETPFDLTRGPLLRTALLRLAADDHVLVVVMHHIVSDGASLQVIVDDFSAHYAHHAAQPHGGSTRPLALPAPPIRYTDYAAWQRSWLAAGERDRQLAHWRAQLGEAHPVLQLPADHPRQADARYRTAQHRLALAPALVRGLRGRAEAGGATLFVLLLAAYQALLARSSGQHDVRVGVPTANRHRPETEGVVGFFVNTQVHRNLVHGRLPLAQLLAQARDAALAAQAHQDLPFDQLVDALQPERSLGTHPLFQVMFNHQRVNDRPLAWPGLSVQPHPLALPAAQFELTLDTTEHPDGRVHAVFSAAAELFEPATIARYARHYEALLTAFVQQPHQALDDVVLLGTDERAQLARWGQADGRAPRYRAPVPVHRLFEQQARAQPQAPAVRQGDAALDYATLNRRANRLAHRLAALGVRAETRVAIALPRSVAWPIAVLAVLKAGGAYLPLDPSHPTERLAYVLADSGATLLLTDRATAPRLAPRDSPLAVLMLDTLALDGEPATDLPAAAHPGQLAYVIYTSGSTGRPKGVAVSHGPLSMHCQETALLYEMTPQSCELHFLSFSFDGAHERLLTALSCGASLVLRDAALWSTEQTLAQLQARRVSHAGFPPAYLQALAQEARDSGQRPPVRLYSFGGEAMPRAGFDAVRDHLRPQILINGYGPTEAVVTPMLWKTRGEAGFSAAYTPIGRPVGDRKALVLDAGLGLVPPGVAGELYLGGEGLARGYLGRAALTAERFVADPAAGPAEPGARLYRTGDLVRWSAEGQLEYLGRLDQQVKVRGFRIELGEVEAQLLAQPGVGAAVAVVGTGPGGARLLGYVAPQRGQALDAAALRERLARTLPDYMVPAAIVVLAQLPLGPHGKVDRQQLPEPAIAVDAAGEAPQSPAETTLAAIWAELLGLARVGRHDNFFELGGDSILSLQIVARARRAGWLITPRQVFERQTPAQLAAVAQAQAQAPAAAAPVVEGEVPLLPIQHEFFALPLPVRQHWNQSLLLQSAAPLQPGPLRDALAALVLHHDSLRLRYTQQPGGRWQQAYAAVPAGQLQELLWVRSARDAGEVQALCQEAQRSLDLAHGPLLRGLAIALADGSARLLLAVHHLVVDGVSWRILLEDLQAAYAQRCAGQAIVLPAKTASYRDWAQALHTHARAQHSAVVPEPALAKAPVSLPCDHPGGSRRAAALERIEWRLAAPETEALLKHAPAAYRTQVGDLLLTALGRALCAWSGHDRLRIDVEGHGREDLGVAMDLSRTVGWFTSLYPVVLAPTGEMATALKRVKESLRRLPRHGLDHGVLKHLGSAAQQQALQALPPAAVVFNYLGQFDASFDGDAAAWRPAPEPAGADVDAAAPQAHEFSIDGQVYRGELALGVRYSGERYARATVERWVQRFDAELRALLAHCLGGAAGITPSDVPLAGLGQPALDALPLAPAALHDLYPLSPLQAGMLFHSLYDAGGQAYLTQLRLQVDGLDEACFRAAWQAVLARHEVLRTGFLAQLEPPLQWVARHAELPWQVHDLRGQNPTEAELDAIAQAELARGFDLAAPPLMRLALLRLGERRYHVVWTSHHLLLDGWSSAQLLAEVLRLYAGQPLPAVAGRYRDHIAWLQQRDPAAGERHWRERLAQLPAPTRLAPALDLPQAAPGQAGHRSALSPARTRQLADAARRERVTLNTLLQAAWALVLARATGQGTVCFGSTVAGRPAELPGAEQMLGLFINTLPVIATLRAAQPLGDWLRALQADNLAAREHEHTPLAEIQRWAGQGGQALFDSLVVFENFPVDAALHGAAPGGPTGGLTVGPAHSRDDTHYPMTLAAHLRQAAGPTATTTAGDVLVLDYRYLAARFEAHTVQALAAQVEQALAAMAASCTPCVGDVSLVADTERAQLLRWGQGAADLPPGDAAAEPVHRVFERQVRQQPQALALVHGELQLSRAEFNARANRLAHRLVALGAAPEARVGIALPRSPEMLVAVLAVIKAGAAYVPLDPAYPADRLAAMVADSGLALVVTQASVALPPLAGAQRLDLDGVAAPASSAPDHDLPDGHTPHPQQLAYVIYTSGSTGRPKGVGISHGALARHAQVAASLFGLTERDRMLQFATLNFDGFVEQFFAPLASGAAIVLRGPELWSSVAFHDALVAQQVTVADLTTAYWLLLAQDAAQHGSRGCGPLRRVHAGGEALPPEGLKAWRASAFAPVALLNTYGPTEATVTATALDCAPYVAGPLAEALPAQMPIGGPLAGRRLYVVDADLNLVPAGVAGELCLGGPLLARGYLGRAGLSAERFIADPFADLSAGPLAPPGGRLYRTGDLVRWNRAGQLDYLGRLDHQVKIRGFRVELGEIEAQLLAQPAVREAVVLALPSAGGLRLVAYVSARPGAVAEAGALRQQLAAALPEPLLPLVVVLPGPLPLNPNGKVDRHALPPPEPAATADHEPPHGPHEAALAAIWAEVLGVARIGRRDHFFELGGHSLLAVRLVGRIQQAGTELPLRTLFEHPVFADFAQAVPPAPAAGGADRMAALLAEFDIQD